MDLEEAVYQIETYGSDEGAGEAAGEHECGFEAGCEGFFVEADEDAGGDDAGGDECEECE